MMNDENIPHEKIGIVQHPIDRTGDRRDRILGKLKMMHQCPMSSQYNPDKHHRRSIRLQGYDYASAGSYFITICAHQRECLFGEIVEGQMMLNTSG